MVKIQKTTVLKFLKVICFLIIFVFLFSLFSFMLMPKTNTKSGGIDNPSAKAFYAEPESTIDLFVIGNSDAYSAFSPMELWNKYGYTSYVSAEPMQEISGAVNMLKEILTCQSPKLVILEVDGVWTGYKDSKSLHSAIDSSITGLSPLFQYHNRWKKVSIGEIFSIPKYSWRCATKGQYLSKSTDPYLGKEYMIKSDSVEDIPVAAKIFLDAFVDLCRENNIQLLLLTVPSRTSWTYPKHNAMMQYAAEQSVPYLDLDLIRSDYGFDWKTDTRDKGYHLNTLGAQKLTSYLGEYISLHYHLQDYRDNPSYDQWEKDYIDYLKTIA